MSGKDHGNRISRKSECISQDTPQDRDRAEFFQFGIPSKDVVDIYREASDLPGINPCGIHCHIGSQILETEPFIEAANKMMDLVEKVKGAGIDLKFVDMGSGLGIRIRKEKKRPNPAILQRRYFRCSMKGQKILVYPKTHS